ncbi:MAG: sigma-70 family RNA polymerase sigma factor [Tetrasphaera sp.]
MSDGPQPRSNRPVDDEVSHLVLAARDGDPEAWRELVDRFARLVYAVAVRCRLTPADAADVSQTAWLRLAENLHRINDPSRVGAWLVTTTKRESLALIKARARYEPVDVQVIDVVDERDGPADQVSRSETITEVATAFALLTERCRELLRRLVVESQNYQQISAEMEMPVGSIGPTRIRCLASLRRHLEEAADAR